MQPPLDEARRDTAEDTQWSRPQCQAWTGALLLGTCLLYCARASVPVCTVAMSQDFGWNKKEAGIVLSSFFWGYCLTQVVGGHLGDRIGGEKVIVLSASAWGSITAATPLLAHLGGAHLVCMTLSRVLMGLLQGVYFPALTSLLSQKVRESERAFTYSTVGAGSQIGTLLTGVVGSALLEWHSWQSVFYFSGSLTLLWAWYVHRPRPGLGRPGAGPAGVQAQQGPLEAALPEAVCLVRRGPGDRWVSEGGTLVLRGTGLCHLPLSPGRPSSPSSAPPAPSSSSCPGCPPSSRRPSRTPRAGSSTWCPGWWPFQPACSAGSSLTISSVRPYWAGPTPGHTRGPHSGLTGTPFCGPLRSGYRPIVVRKFMQVMGLGLSGIFALCLGHTSSFFESVVFASASIGLQTFNHSGISVNIQDLAPSCAGFLFGVANTAGAVAGVVGVCLGGYLIETTGSWTYLFNLVAVTSNLGLCTFLVFGQAQRVDLSPAREDL
ncbi:PREDICTED: solute carrier family 17 member 9 isoform X4 [Propithecus coquereli]|uniref:solute carrier family 17 member 9 isoform X4 n=1 Tax=Propithecus coquereli TaxID=379532 RepID=UPI00063F26E2|nr:PREDICTED: solute carrier family 17 member 9 isoform X4 [Propithecus coquereli]